MPGEQASIKRESPVALLLLKLEAWMVVQPEWLLIVNMPRQQRRAAMKELANRLYTIPELDASPAPGLNRKVRRGKPMKGFTRLAEQKAARDAELGALTALAQASLMEEAAASVALDGETQSVQPDPEGDVKADVEQAKEAEEANDEALS